MTPREVHQALREYDAALRLKRSGPYYGDYDMVYNGGTLHVPTYYYRVERKLPGHVKLIIDPPNELQDLNDAASARERYILIFNVQPNQLDDRIFYTLYFSDLARMNAKEMANEITDPMKRNQEKARNAFGFHVEAEAREAVRYMNTIRTVSEKHCHTAPVGGMSIMGD